MRTLEAVEVPAVCLTTNLRMGRIHALVYLGSVVIWFFFLLTYHSLAPGWMVLPPPPPPPFYPT